MTEKKTVQEIIEKATKWYAFDSLPEFGTAGFMGAVGSSMSIIYAVAADKVHAPVTVKFDPNIETAYVDMKRNVIGIAARFLNPDLYTNVFGEDTFDPQDTNKLAIGVMNGEVVHESLHLRHTKEGAKDPQRAIRNHYMFEKVQKKGFNMQTLFSAFNIFEDLYIESHTPEKLADWVQIKNDFLFTEIDALERGTMFLIAPSIQTYINLAIAFKNPRLREMAMFSLFTPAQREILESVFELEVDCSVFKRITLAFRFLLAFEMPEDDGEENGDGDGSSDSDGETEETRDGDSDDTPKNTMPEDSGDEFKNAVEQTANPDDSEVAAANAELAERGEEIAAQETGKGEFETEFDKAEWGKVVELDVFDAPNRGEDGVSIDKGQNYKFVEELVAKRTPVRSPGAARKSGTVMVKSRLTRIATDGKIFAKNDTTRNTVKRIEVIINIDMSASTSGKIYRNEISSAYEMSKALRKARIAHAVYGHTSLLKVDGDDWLELPLIIHIYSYDMQHTNNDFEERFDAARKVLLRENFDGVAINVLVDKFTGKDATKYMFNLSDGSPCAPGYNNKAADEHTKQVIAAARARGINVLSLSVVAGVVHNNNQIYGRQFNIDASVNVGASFRKVISGIA